MLTIVAEVEDKYSFELNQTIQWIIEREITAASQAAYQRGWEEALALVKNLLLNPYGDKVQAINGESPAKVCGRVLGAIFAANANQPAQTATTDPEQIPEWFYALEQRVQRLEAWCSAYPSWRAKK